MDDEAGFTLLEMVCVLAIVGLMAALLLPHFPRSTSRERLNGYALEAAAMLKADRFAAVRTGRPVSTALSAQEKAIRSGSTGAVLRFPDDVAFDAILAQRCGDRKAGSTIDFFPSGLSCGGTLLLARPGAGLRIRVNWMTGGVEVVSVDKG